MSHHLTDMGIGAQVIATCPFEAYPETGRVCLGTRLKDQSDLFVWMSKEDFLASLRSLQEAARRLGIPWPDEVSEPGR